MPGQTNGIPFVGRRRELATLLRCLDEAANGQGRVALLAGEPGIGKTRLLAEFAGRARAAGWQVLAGRAYELEGMPPYAPFSEALRDYLRAAPAAELRVLLEEAGSDLTLLAPVLRRRLPDLAAVPVPSGNEQRYQLFESVCALLLGLARQPGVRGLSSSSMTSTGPIRPACCYSNTSAAAWVRHRCWLRALIAAPRWTAPIPSPRCWRRCSARACLSCSRSAR